MTKDKIISPITKSSNVELITEIPTTLIVNKYKKELKINVERFFKTQIVEIYKCLDTGFLFYYPLDVVGDDKLYEELQQLEGYYSTWNWEHQVTFNIIKQNDKVLEVGCGSGSFIQKLKSNYIEATGLELNKKAVKVCLQAGLNVYDELLEEHIKTHANFYDVVCSFQVLEHIQNPRSYIEACIQATKVGGKIIFGVPNNNPYLFKRDKYHTLNLPPHHMGLWSVKAFDNLPKHFDVKTVKIEVEKLYNTRYYLNTFFYYNNLSFLETIINWLPKRAVDKIASYRKWQGRNIVAIFEKT